MSRDVPDARCAQGKEPPQQQHRRVRREYAEVRRLERELGPTRYKKWLEGDQPRDAPEPERRVANFPGGFTQGDAHLLVVAARDEEIAEAERKWDEWRARYRREKKQRKRAESRARHWKHNHAQQVRRVRQIAEQLARAETLCQDAYRYQQAAEDLLNPEQERAQKAEADLASLKERLLGEVRTELGMLGLMLRENQRHEEGDRDYYDEKGERTNPRRLMHDGKANAYRHAEANLAPILAALDKALSIQPNQENTFQAGLAEVEGGAGSPIPEDYWRSIPCGHPPDPVAMYDEDGKVICHCGKFLSGTELPGLSPHVLMRCQNCGCHVLVLPKPEQPNPVEAEARPPRSACLPPSMGSEPGR